MHHIFISQINLNINSLYAIFVFSKVTHDLVVNNHFIFICDRFQFFRIEIRANYIIEVKKQIRVSILSSDKTVAFDLIEKFQSSLVFLI